MSLFSRLSPGDWGRRKGGGSCALEVFTKKGKGTNKPTEENKDKKQSQECQEEEEDLKSSVSPQLGETRCFRLGLAPTAALPPRIPCGGLQSPRAGEHIGKHATCGLQLQKTSGGAQPLSCVVKVRRGGEAKLQPSGLTVAEPGERLSDP